MRKGEKKTWRSGPPSRSPGEDILRKLYVEDVLSLARIGERFDVSNTSVRRWLLAAGISTRDRAQARRVAARPTYTEAGLAAKRQAAEAMRARVTPEGLRRGGEKRRGLTPPNKGKSWTPAQREKLEAVRRTDEYRRKMSECRKGEKAHNWRGGKVPGEKAHLNGWEWRKRRRECYERDRWTCRDCGAKCLSVKDSRTKVSRRIQCHHIVARRDGGGDELENLVTLCASCHRKREIAYGKSLA